MKTYGGYGGVIELHDDHLTICRDGALANAAGLGATREIPLVAITAVALKPASMAVNGYLQLQLGGDQPRDHRGDPNTVLFRRKQNSEFKELADLLQKHAAEKADAESDISPVEVGRGSTGVGRLEGRGDSDARVTLPGAAVDSPHGQPSAEADGAADDRSSHLEMATHTDEAINVPSPVPEIPGADQHLIGKLRPRVRRALRENLLPGEQVRVVVRGDSGQAIVGTDTRAFVCKPGFMAGASFGIKVTTWSYTHIVGVQLHKGMVSGAVVIQAPGQTGIKTSSWGHEKDDPGKVPNAITVTGNWDEVNSKVAELRRLIAAHEERGSPVSSIVQSPLDQVRQLGELRDAGMLSDQEFEDKKRELLSRM